MRAFEQGITKKEFVTELKRHQKLDSFIRGTYADVKDGKFRGCAVGCSLKSVSQIKNIQLSTSTHQHYETYLGIPEWLARVEDRIFENVSVKRSKKWPVEFANAINKGADLNKIKNKWLLVCLKVATESFDHKKWPLILEEIKNVERLLKKKKVTSEEWFKARDAVCEARRPAADAYAAAAAVYAYAAADDYAYAYAAAAAHAAADAYAAADARIKKYEYMANQLLKILKGCK